LVGHNWKTPWYVGQAAIAKIKSLLKEHPELRMKLVDAEISVINGYDHDILNDIFIVNPGKLVKSGIMKESIIDRIKNFIEAKFGKKKVKKVRGYGKVRFVQYDNGDWQLLVNDEPFVMKGVTYDPTRVGEGPDDGTKTNWMDNDYNNNIINYSQLCIIF